jgi:hypothetical protein
MDFSGLVGKYSTNRLLTEQERAHQLRQKHRLNVEPHYQLSVIKMNSNYLESLDKWFGWKGVLTAISTVIVCIFAYGAIFVGFGEGPIPWTNMTSGQKLAQCLFTTCILLLSLPLIWLAVWLLRKESFAYTHYPMRFNRKTRIVHIFRTDGTVLSVPWDQVFFTLGHMAQWNEWEVRGHVMEPDNVTVKETFALSYVGSLNETDVASGSAQSSGQDFVRGHWEFIRRYMEDGPQALSSQVQFCMPVDERRESFRVSGERVFANIAGAPVLIYWMLFPVCLLVSLFRLIAMGTSKIPRWPEEIEAACAIEPGDPYAIEGARNGDRVAVFPEAAHVPRAGFCAPPGNPSDMKKGAS